MKCTFTVQHNEYCIDLSEKDENRKRVSWQFFNSVFIFCLKYFMTLMIYKKSKGNVPYLHTQINYKSITVYIKNKTRGGN